MVKLLVWVLWAKSSTAPTVPEVVLLPPVVVVAPGEVVPDVIPPTVLVIPADVPCDLRGASTVVIDDVTYCWGVDY